MACANQDVYNGEWKYYYQDGIGTKRFHNGDVYEGEFSVNQMHGRGTYSYATGDILKSIGEWKEGWIF